MVQGNITANTNQHQQRNVGADASGILQPFADVQANNVEQNRHAQQAERRPQRVDLVICQMAIPGTADEYRHSDAGSKQAGKVEEGVDPVGPSRHKAVKIAERLFAPDIEAAFSGKTGGKLDDDQRRGQKEQQGGQNPQADGRGAVVGSGGDPARSQNSGYVEKEYIPEAHLPPEQ